MNSKDTVSTISVAHSYQSDVFNLIMKTMLYSTVVLSLVVFPTVSLGGRIVYPYRATTAIVLSGSTFEVWLSVDAGQTVNSITLIGPYNTVAPTYSTSSTSTWTYDQWSAKTCNLKLVVTVPANTPSDRYDLLVNTSTETMTSLKAVKVIKEYKTSYFIFHMSDGHRWESISTRDSMTSLREQNALIGVANIIDPEMIVETGDNMWGNNQTLIDKMKRAVTYFSGGVKGTEVIRGMNDAYAAVFTVPGNHDAHTNGYESTTVPVCARDWNDLFGLENHSFTYGNARYIGINNAWCPTTGGGAAGYVPNYKWQLDQAIEWINGVGGGNFRMSFQHVPQESLPPIYNRFKDAGQSLSLMIAGHIHRYTTNPYSIDGRPIIYTVAIFGTASDRAPFNLYKIDANAGTFTPYPNSYANNEAVSINKDYSTTKLKLTYSKTNDGSNSDNVGTIVNSFSYELPGCRIRFVMPKGNTYVVTGGTVKQEFDGTNYHIVDVSCDLSASSTKTVSIDATVQTITTNHQIIPKVYALEQNYPNPFNPSTTIRYALPRRSNVDIEVFNMMGQKIASLVQDRQAAGEYRVLWNGGDSAGMQVASGVYICRMRVWGDSEGQSDGQFFIKKLVLVR